MNLPRTSIDFMAGWRGLGRFWAALLVIFGVVGGTLATVKPPVSHVAEVGSLAQTLPVVPTVTDHHPPPDKTQPEQSSPTAVKAGIKGADPALLEPYQGEAGSAAPGAAGRRTLPRIGADGRTPMAAYAAPFDRSSNRPRAGLLIAGLGMSKSDSLTAAQSLPGGITLAVSPYAVDLDPLLEAVREGGHEYLMSIPMEPKGFPSNDPDDRRALMTSLTPEVNLDRLRWVMSRATGYVGVTDAIGPMAGTRLMSVADQINPLLREVGQRGLLFIDSRLDRAPLAGSWSRSIDILIDDDPLHPATLDRRLEELTRLALTKRSALGFVSIPRPVTLARIAVWADALRAKGVDLAPVSALALPPQD